MKVIITIEIEESKSLSDEDRELIKQAVLQAAANRPTYPVKRLADEIIEVFKMLNSQTA